MTGPAPPWVRCAATVVRRPASDQAGQGRDDRRADDHDEKRHAEDQGDHGEGWRGFIWFQELLLRMHPEAYDGLNDGSL